MSRTSCRTEHRAFSHSDAIAQGPYDISDLHQSSGDESFHRRAARRSLACVVRRTVFALPTNFSHSPEQLLSAPHLLDNLTYSQRLSSLNCSRALHCGEWFFQTTPPEAPCWVCIGVIESMPGAEAGCHPNPVHDHDAGSVSPSSRGPQRERSLIRESASRLITCKLRIVAL